MPHPRIAVQGIPYDQSSSFLRGCAGGPDAIRAAFHSDSSNYFTESGVDLQEHAGVRDVGNLDLGEQPIEQIEQATFDLLSEECNVVTLGGDHFITFPILKAFARKYDKVNLVQFDAHPDLYDELDGNRHSHACPFARAHEAGLVARHVQIGIRTMTDHQRAQADRFGVEVLPIDQPPQALSFAGPLYVTLDLDVLDPAFAPGISHYEPGGLSVRDVLRWIAQIDASQLVGADIVELNPTRDSNNLTAMVAAKFYKELLGRMLES